MALRSVQIVLTKDRSLSFAPIDSIHPFFQKTINEKSSIACEQERHACIEDECSESALSFAPLSHQLFLGRFNAWD